MEISRAFLLAFHGRQAEENLSPLNLPVHVPLLLPSCPSFILQRFYLTAHKSQQKFLTKISDFTAIFLQLSTVICQRAQQEALCGFNLHQAPSPQPQQLSRISYPCCTGRGQEAWNWIIRVKEKGKSKHCYSRLEPGPPCVKVRSKMPLSLWHRTAKVKCSHLKKATVRSHIARWPWMIQALQLPSFQCKVWIGWWEGGAGGAGSAHWPTPWKHLQWDGGCIFGAVLCYQNRAWNALCTELPSHFSQSAHSGEIPREQPHLLQSLFVLTWNEIKLHTHIYLKKGLVISRLIRMKATLQGEGGRRKQNCCWSNTKFAKYVPGSCPRQ